MGTTQRTRQADAGDGNQGQSRLRVVAVRARRAHVDGRGQLSRKQREWLPRVSRWPLTHRYRHTVPRAAGGVHGGAWGSRRVERTVLRHVERDADGGVGGAQQAYVVHPRYREPKQSQPRSVEVRGGTSVDCNNRQPQRRTWLSDMRKQTVEGVEDMYTERGDTKGVLRDTEVASEQMEHAV